MDTIKSVKKTIYVDDLPESALEEALKAGLVAWDIETSGLDWKNDRIGICQVYIPGYQVYVVRIGEGPHDRLKNLLGHSDVCKVFHHAMFDLRFMAYQWSTSMDNVACTRIASKIADPFRSHSLKSLVEDYFGVSLDKTLRISNWLADELTSEQIGYAVADVIYLPQLFRILQKELVEKKRWHLAEASFKYIPTRVMLDILGYGDLFQYSTSHTNNNQ